MPVPLPNELRGTAGESQDDLLEVSVFALPDLEAVPEQALDLSAGRFLSSKTSFGERPSA